MQENNNQAFDNIKDIESKKIDIDNSKFNDLQNQVLQEEDEVNIYTAPDWEYNIIAEKIKYNWISQVKLVVDTWWFFWWEQDKTEFIISEDEFSLSKVEDIASSVDFMFMAEKADKNFNFASYSSINIDVSDEESQNIEKRTARSTNRFISQIWTVNIDWINLPIKLRENTLDFKILIPWIWGFSLEKNNGQSFNVLEKRDLILSAIWKFLDNKKGDEAKKTNISTIESTSVENDENNTPSISVDTPDIEEIVPQQDENPNESQKTAESKEVVKYKEISFDNKYIKFDLQIPDVISWDSVQVWNYRVWLDSNSQSWDKYEKVMWHEAKWTWFEEWEIVISSSEWKYFLELDTSYFEWVSDSDVKIPFDPSSWESDIKSVVKNLLSWYNYLDNNSYFNTIIWDHSLSYDDSYINLWVKNPWAEISIWTLDFDSSGDISPSFSTFVTFEDVNVNENTAVVEVRVSWLLSSETFEIDLSKGLKDQIISLVSLEIKAQNKYLENQDKEPENKKPLYTIDWLWINNIGAEFGNALDSLWNIVSWNSNDNNNDKGNNLESPSVSLIEYENRLNNIQLFDWLDFVSSLESNSFEAIKIWEMSFIWNNESWDKYTLKLEKKGWYLQISFHPSFSQNNEKFNLVITDESVLESTKDLASLINERSNLIYYYNDKPESEPYGINWFDIKYDKKNISLAQNRIDYKIFVWKVNWEIKSSTSSWLIDTMSSELYITFWPQNNWQTTIYVENPFLKNWRLATTTGLTPWNISAEQIISFIEEYIKKANSETIIEDNSSVSGVISEVSSLVNSLIN